MKRKFKKFLYARSLPALLGKSFLVLLGVTFLAIVYRMGSLGPHRITSPANNETPLSVDNSQELLLQSDALKDRFHQIKKTSTPQDQDWDLLHQAITLKERFFDIQRPTDPELHLSLEALQKEYQDFKCESIYHLSLQAEKKATANTATPDVGLLRKASQFQKVINEDFPQSSYKDTIRLVNLERSIKETEAKALYEESLTIEMQAEDAFQEDDIQQTQILYNTAIDIQKRLNADYSMTASSNAKRLKHLYENLGSLESRTHRNNVDLWSSKAEDAFQEGKIAQAILYYKSAIAWQKRLNETFKESPFASEKKAQKLEEKHHTAIALEHASNVKQSLDQLTQLLQNHKFSEASNCLTKTFSAFKISEGNTLETFLNDKQLADKLNYLYMKKGLFKPLHNAVFEHASPLPASPSTYVLNTEVSQEFYSRVMNCNPSRNKGKTLPVDSVTWPEAKTFCQKLSWILGHNVRLLRKDEFLNIIGNPSLETLSDSSWNASNSKLKTQAPALKTPTSLGYYDLLGNVNEWLEDLGPETGYAYLAGGDVNDSPQELLDSLLKSSRKKDRSRFNGFRIVVELN